MNINNNTQNKRGRKKTPFKLKRLEKDAFILFKKIRSQFGYNLCQRRLIKILSDCFKMTNLFLKDCEKHNTDKIHINLSDEQHLITFKKSTTRAASILKKCLAIGVLKREQGVSPKDPKCLFIYNADIHKAMKSLNKEVFTWTEKDFKHFTQNLDFKQKEYEENYKKNKKVDTTPLEERQKKFFTGMELTGVEHMPLNKAVNNFIYSKEIPDTNPKIDWNEYYNENKQNVKVNTDEIMESLKVSLQHEEKHIETDNLENELLENS